MNFACEKKSWARLRKNHILERDFGCCNNERSQHAVASRAGTIGVTLQYGRDADKMAFIIPS